MNDDIRAGLASRAAALLAVDPFGLGGAVLRGPVSAARDAWLAVLRATFQSPHGEEPQSGVSNHEGSRGRDRRTAFVVRDGLRPPHHEGYFGNQLPWRRLPPGVAEGRLVGGLDLTATLAAGRPVAEKGLLAQTDGGILVVPMAERLGAGIAGLLSQALDSGEIVVEREGLASRAPARFAAILLDEGGDDEQAPAALAERLAFRLDLTGLRPNTIEIPDPATIAAVRDRLDAMAVPDDVVEALALAGAMFGVPSLRIATFALRAAKAAAALAGRTRVLAEDAELAAALVIAPRATTLPAADAEDDTPEPPPPDTPDAEQGNDEPDQQPGQEKPLSDSVVEATRAAIPAGLLAMLSLAASGMRRSTSAGKGGALKQTTRRGRPAGTRRGQPGHGVRLAVVDTLRAAAPWQGLRRQAMTNPPPDRLLIRRDDFRVGRFKQRSETVTIFVVDASGSAALHRLAEVKGAVELILAECYVRRDSVALIAFRGAKAEMILPPTRSLARAKRALAGQAGGGGTPLAAAIDTAALLADRVRRAGQVPMVVLLTDGKANISRAGQPGRGEAEADAHQAAQAFRVGGVSSVVLDIAPRPGEAAARLAHVMGSRYIPLPYADAQSMSRVVLAATPAARSNV